jgi:thermostable 8-oxoguanine DNA glycosylase
LIYIEHGKYQDVLNKSRDRKIMESQVICHCHSIPNTKFRKTIEATQKLGKPLFSKYRTKISEKLKMSTFFHFQTKLEGETRRLAPMPFM